MKGGAPPGRVSQGFQAVVGTPLRLDRRAVHVFWLKASIPTLLACAGLVQAAGVSPRGAPGSCRRSAAPARFRTPSPCLSGAEE